MINGRLMQERDLLQRFSEIVQELEPIFRARLTEELVIKYGEKHRVMIMDALKWLSERESVWGILVDKSKFIQDLVAHARN
jgi:hypothetical protein